jgi:hypothetical protein
MSKKPEDGQMESAFLEIMKVLRALPTEQARYTMINWAYEAMDQRPGPLSETGGRRAAPPLPDVLYGVRHGEFLLRQRFTSEENARKWAVENYRGQPVFEIEQIAVLDDDTTPH